MAAEKRVIDSPWLSAEEAAAYVRRTVKTVQNWTSAGKIRVYHPDARPLYHKRDLDKFIESHVLEPVGAS